MMTCTSSRDYFQSTDQVPISLTDLKSILSNLTSKETLKLSASPTSDPQHRSKPQLKKYSRPSLPLSQLYGETVLSSLLTSSSTSAIHISRQDAPDVYLPPKRYIASFKTLAHSTHNKQTQRLNYINDSVMILKLSKEQTNGGSVVNSHVSNKVPSLSPTNTTMSMKTQQPPSPFRLSPVLRIEGQKRRILHHDPSLSIGPAADLTITSQQMTTSTSSHPQPNPSVFTYRSTAAGGNTVRQRVIADPPPSSLLITAERFKTNLSSTMRPTRQPSISTTPYIPPQQPQRNPPPNNRSRVQLEKLKNSRDQYEYVDPFTNCPQDLMSKLAYLTKLQVETIEWEKKKKFTKKKPAPNAALQGKDSP